MEIIESFTHLRELRGLCPPLQEDDTFLDKLFKSCGSTLKKLTLQITGGHIPQVFHKSNRVLNELTIQWKSSRPLTTEEVVRLCQDKREAFKLTVEGMQFEIDQLTEVIRLCPTSVINLHVNLQQPIFGDITRRVFK